MLLKNIFVEGAKVGIYRLKFTDNAQALLDEILKVEAPLPSTPPVTYSYISETVNMASDIRKALVANAAHFADMTLEEFLSNIYYALTNVSIRQLKAFESGWVCHFVEVGPSIVWVIAARIEGDVFDIKVYTRDVELPSMTRFFL